MEKKEPKSVFETLNAINVNGHTETKNNGRVNLTYLSWAWAWAEVKKAYPLATYTIYENRDGLNYHHDGRTAWVKTGVTIEGIEMIEYLPVMDNRNASIPLGRLTSFDVNKTIQRSLTKACARHGLGLYIYAGEDIPEDAKAEQPKQGKPATFAAAPAKDGTPTIDEQTWIAKVNEAKDTDTIKSVYAQAPERLRHSGTAFYAAVIQRYQQLNNN